jgi:glucose-6-phosphate 1-dehydrogenase
MEPPATLGADPIRREKLKVLHSIAPVDPREVIFGQYVGEDGQEGYLEHDGVPEDSTTETFVALRLRIENWRWQGVPFVLRTGKRLPQRLTEIDVYFRCPPVQLFGGPNHCSITRNVLRIRLQPDEGFTLGFEVKAPGSGFQLSSQHFDFEYEKAFGPLPSAYETLLADVVAGDQTLFVHADETEAAWALFEPLLDADIPVKDYPSGSWGPDRAARMLVADRRAPTPEEEFAS